jgi:hypothetical protein
MKSNENKKKNEKNIFCPRQSYQVRQDRSRCQSDWAPLDLVGVDVDDHRRHRRKFAGTLGRKSAQCIAGSGRPDCFEGR